jgi:hypothetical protein
MVKPNHTPSKKKIQCRDIEHLRVIASSLEDTLAVEVRAYTLLRNDRSDRVHFLIKDCKNLSFKMEVLKIKWRSIILAE